MDIANILALALLAFVVIVASTGWIHRALAAAIGAVGALAWWGWPALGAGWVPEVILVTAGLMLISGSIKRSGWASWLALKAAKLSRGRPGWLLVWTGLLAALLGALLGPVAAVALLVPVVLLLAVELDVAALPFVVVLSWCALWGATSTLTALPGNLWLAASLGVDGFSWTTRLLPFTVTGVVVTLLLGWLVFRSRLRVTNERRARVLEYDEAQSLTQPRLALQAALVLLLMGGGLALAPAWHWSPALIVLAGAALLWVVERPRSDVALADLDGGTLVFYGGLMTVVAALTASGVAVATAWNPTLAGLVTALVATVVDRTTAVGLMLPWLSPTGPAVWVYVALGASLGAGVTVLGSQAAATSLALTGAGPRRVTVREVTVWGLVFATTQGLAFFGLSLLFPLG